MPEIRMPGEKPVVDFDYFDLDSGYNYRQAEQLSAILIANINIDDIHGLNDEDGVYFNSTVGTGGTGMNYACNSRGAQRACLASHFAAYAHRQYQSCYLSLFEYQCLNELLEDLEDPPSHREKVNNEHRELIKQVCRQFEIAYTTKDPGFLFTLLKNM